MDHHFQVLDRTKNIPLKMGSHNGYGYGSAHGNYNGASGGVIFSNVSKLGKQQMVNAHAIVASPDEDALYPQQHPYISSTGNPPLTSPQQATSPHINPKDIAQAMTARNGLAKNCASMDHNPTGRDAMRPDMNTSIPSSHHYHPTQIQQHSMISGNTMGGVVVERDYGVDNGIYSNPTTAGTRGIYGNNPGDPQPDSPPSSTSTGENGKSFGRKRSRKRPKTCGVCGDRAKSFHFGGLSCDSCKAFFRRSVQNDAHVAFRCAYDSCCDINISTRKSCQFCRFKKCLSIGMEKSWVMTEEERNALNQQRMEKKQTKPSVSNVSPPPMKNPEVKLPPKVVTAAPVQSAPSKPEPTYTFQGAAGHYREPSALAFHESEYVADVNKMLDYMTKEEQNEIKTVVETYLHAYKSMPFQVSFMDGRRDTLEIIEMFTTILRRFAYFAKLIPDFADLDRTDQGNLLRSAVLEMCLLRGAACFDTENNRWPSSAMDSLKDCPQLRVEDMQRLVSRELFEMHITFILHMKRLRVDEPIAMLLIMTVLFSPERMPIENKVKVNQAQEKYLLLLKKYVIWKFGTTAGSRVYPQLLTKLSDLRQLNDFHTEFHLNLETKEVNAIKKSLEELHLNPYHNWKIVPDANQGSSEDSNSVSPAAPPTPPNPPQMINRQMTQAIIQTFADRRIPTLLDNPYATFETDMSMIRQVQQAFGAFMPNSGGLSPGFAGNDSDQMRSFENSGRPSSISPRGYSSSTDSADAQGFDMLPNTRSYEFHPQPMDIHSHPGGHSGESSSHSVESTVFSGSQPTVLRKHSSTGLPGNTSSVIRTAPPRQVEPVTSVIHQHTSFDAQQARSFNCGNVATNSGWHGGEVRATPVTTNGYDPGNMVPVVTVAGRMHQQMHNRDEYRDAE